MISLVTLPAIMQRSTASDFSGTFWESNEDKKQSVRFWGPPGSVILSYHVSLKNRNPRHHRLLRDLRGVRETPPTVPGPPRSSRNPTGPAVALRAMRVAALQPWLIKGRVVALGRVGRWDVLGQCLSLAPLLTPWPGASLWGSFCALQDA